MHDQATRLREIAGRSGRSTAPGYPRILAVTSGKGGVGKSTLALNLAIHLSAMERSVVLMDGDANLGGLDVMTGISPRFRLSHVLRGERDLEDVLISLRPGLKILPAASGEPDHPIMDQQRQQQLIDDLKNMEERADFLIIDTSAGLTREILGYAEAADETLVVSTPEPTAVMDGYALMKVLWFGKPDADVRLIVSGARTPRESDDTAGKLRTVVSHFLKRELPYAGAIPYDPAVQKAILEQQPLAAMFPRCAASLSLQALACTIVDRSLSQPGRRIALR
jgi:flagellar biosynthesis protein FlhG